MAYENLKSAIKQVIKQNGNQEITGNLLQSTLLSIVNTIGTDYKFLGFITDETVPPASSEVKMLYFVTKAGTYKNFPINAKNECISVGDGLSMVTKEIGENKFWVVKSLITIEQNLGNNKTSIPSLKLVTDNFLYDNIISNVMLNGENVEFYANSVSDNWVFGDSPFLKAETGEYKFYKDAGGWFFVSPFIDVENIKQVLFTGKTNKNTAFAVQYDSNKSILNVIDKTTSVSLKDEPVDILDNAKYIRFCADIRCTDYYIKAKNTTYRSVINRLLTEFQSTLLSTVNTVNNLSSGYKFNSDNTVRTYTDSNPINIVSTKPGLTSIFHNWGFIGDSLSSGANYDKYNKSIFVNYDYSWCQRIIAMIGQAKGSNWSVPGYTAKSWITQYWNNEQKAPYETTGADSYFKTDKKQIYTIYLGTNDVDKGVTLGDYDSDVDLSNFENNADTFIGNYVGIIQRIKSIAPSAKIFVLTCVPSSSAETGGYNDFIRSLPEKFTNVFLVDLAKYMPRNATFDSDYIRAGHFSTQGYQYLAYCITSYIDYIIRKNPDAFKFVQIINTSYDDGTY